jgi:flagellin
MGLRIATNVQSITAQRDLSRSTAENQSAMERLSSGYRINKASDDAAGLAISEQLKADIRGLGQAKRNASDGISLIQTAEGSLTEVGNILVRLRELAVQAASDTIGQGERGFVNQEFGALKEEISRITRSTEYNGTMLIAGNPDDLPEDLTKESNRYPLEIQVGKNHVASLDSLDNAEPVNVVRIDLSEIDASLGENGLDLGADLESGASAATKEDAQSSINKLDTAITKVSGYRSTLGSLQSRLSSTINNVDVAIENNTAANSRIRDTDFAAETARLTQTSILKQSGVAILAQANAGPQAALRLIG